MSTQSRPVLRWTLILIAVAGLAIDAIAHFAMAKTYGAGTVHSSISQATLFRIEAVIAIVVGLALLIWPRRLTAALAFLTGAGGAILVTIYRYFNIGKLGPIPGMYDNAWLRSYSEPWKFLSLWAEIATALASLALFFVLHANARRTSGATAPTHRGNPVQATG